MTEQNKNEITPLLEQINLNTLLDIYEYNPKLYSLKEIDCAELTANNVVETLREEMNDFINRVLNEHEQKLRDTDTLHIFCMICHHMWGELNSVTEYYLDECEKTRTAILEQMKCEDDARHFEDFMNEPESQTSDIEICRNNHSQRNGDCAFCTEVCCPQSSVNEV